MANCKNLASILVLAFFLITFLVAPISQTRAQTNLPSFPGAEGYGADTRGGRSGRIIKVTNTNSAGPGSLRAAMEASGPRIVVFDVAGTINLSHDEIQVKGESSAFLTVAGQTAPRDGIAIDGRIELIDTHDIVLRYLRIRADDPGGPGNYVDDADGIKFLDEVENVIIDHCSVSWATDENFTFISRVGTGKKIKNVTIQWSVAAEGDRDSYHSESSRDWGSHSAGMLITSRPGNPKVENISVHHNFITHNNARNPRIGGNLRGNVINNLIYNWHRSGTVVTSKVEGNPQVSLVNNYYKAGPNSSDDDRKPIIVTGQETGGGIVNLYETGNLFEKTNGEVSGVILNVKPEVQLHRLDSPPLPIKVSLQSTTVAKNAILANVGVNLPVNEPLGRNVSVRDSVDKRLINEFNSGTGSVGIGDGSDNAPRSYAPLASAPAPQDSDDDGMPNYWENEKGLNPNSPPGSPDHNLDRDGDGYTNIEEYINSLAAGTLTPTPTLPPFPIVVDIFQLFSDWLSSTSDYDLISDGKVNSLDFGGLLLL